MRWVVLLAASGLLAAAPGSRLAYGTYVPFPWQAGSLGAIAADGSEVLVSVNLTSDNRYETAVTKLSASGKELVFRVSLPPSSPAALAVDGNGNIIITGTAGADFPSTQGVFLPDSGTGFIAKLDSGGKLLWSSRILADPRGVAVDKDGSVYLTGVAGSDFQTTPGVLKTSIGPAECRADSLGIGPFPCVDAFAAKVSAGGEKLLYATLLGGVGSDYGYGIAVDDTGSAYITGETYSLDFPVTAGARQSEFGGAQVFVSGLETIPVGGDGFLMRINSAATQIDYSTYLGGANVDFGTAVVVDAQQNAFVAGTTRSTDFPVTVNALQKEYAGDTSPTPRRSGDAFLARFDAIGRATHITYRGTPDEDNAASIDVTSSRVYLGWSENAGGGACAAPSVVDVIDPATTAVLDSEPVFAPGITVRADTSGLIHIIGGSVGNTPFAITGDALYRAGSVLAARYDFTQPELLAPRCLVNAASSAATRQYGGAPLSVAPGEFISIFGAGLAPDAHVQIGGTELPIIYASDTQINAAVPASVPTGDNTVTVVRDSFSASYPVEVAQVFPGIFTTDGTLAAALNEDGTVNSEKHPARTGDIIALYATGLGPMGNDGQVAAGFRAYITAAADTDVLAMPVLYAGQAPGYAEGLYQVNVQIPAGAATGFPQIQLAFDEPWFERTQDGIRIWVTSAE